MAKAFAFKFYRSKQWKHTKDAYMKSQHGICERCGKPAKIVHHRIWLTPDNINDPNITLNWSNLEALCQECHNAEHIGQPECADGTFFDEEGNLKQWQLQDPKYISRKII